MIALTTSRAGEGRKYISKVVAVRAAAIGKATAQTKSRRDDNLRETVSALIDLNVDSPRSTLASATSCRRSFGSFSRHAWRRSHATRVLPAAERSLTLASGGGKRPSSATAPAGISPGSLSFAPPERIPAEDAPELPGCGCLRAQDLRVGANPSPGKSLPASAHATACE